MSVEATPAAAAFRPHRRRGRAVAVLAAIACAGMLAACTGGSTADNSSGQPTASGKVGDLLRIGIFAGPQTLDPAKLDPAFGYYVNLAYAPLIRLHSDGTLHPGLATSWSFGGADNTELTLHLRKGVKFSDASDLTAQGVVDFFNYFVKAAGPASALIAGDTFTATGPLTVKIKLNSPNSDIITQLTQTDTISQVISPAALKNPSALGSKTFGAGPYVLDPSQTVSGDHYTFTANPNYYDKSSVHWKKVTIRVIANPQSILNALKTGQIDFAVGDPSTVSPARQAGLRVTATPATWNGINLLDRDGKLAKALSDVRVRQALNYATDRAAISNAIFPGTSQPTSQIVVPDGYGYNPDLANAYPYDLAKAKQLLAEAGYANGFTLKLVTADVLSENLLAQAVKQQWQRIGVNLDITDYANVNQYNSEGLGGKFPAMTLIWGGQPIGIYGPSLFLPSAVANPFHTTDTKLQSLWDQDVRATGSAKEGLDRQVIAYLTHQAWFVPVYNTSLTYFATAKITGTSASAKAPTPSLYEIQPAA